MTRRYLAIVECPDAEGEPYGVTVLGFPHAAITTMADRLAEASRQAEDALASAIEDLRRRGIAPPPSLEDGAWPTYDATEFRDPLAIVITYPEPVARAA